MWASRQSSAVSADEAITAAQTNLLRDDTIPRDTKTAKSNNTVYQAGERGWFLVAFDESSGDAYELYAYSDSSNPPTTVVWHARSGTNAVDMVTVSVPILPNMYFKTTGASTVNFYE